MSLHVATRRRYEAHAVRLRLGIVTPGFGRGGAERWCLTLAKHLEGDIEVAGFLTGAAAGPLFREARKIADVFEARDFERFAQRCDVIVAWAWEGLEKLREVFPGRIIAVSHGSPGNEWGDRVTSRMGAVPGVELVGVSRHSLNVWPAGGSGVYLPNGAEVDRITPRVGRDVMRARLKVGPEHKVATFCGRLSPEKRPWLLVSALEWLPSDWRVLICGPDQGGWMDAMKRQPRVVVLPEQDNVGDVLAASDVFVLPSATEAHPIALCEAWLAGVPTVHCDWPFAGQVREDHGSDLGVVVPVSATAEQLAEGIVRADLWRASLTDRARRVAWEHYTAGAMAERWRTFLT